MTKPKKQRGFINIGGLSVSFDYDDVDNPIEAVIVGQVATENFTSGLYVDISNDIKAHESLRHTTTVENFGLIIKNLTLRCSSLTSSKLNDNKEKARLNIERFAGSHFISCFSHITHESVQLWTMYGVKHKNVQLVFKNFSNFFSEAVHMDYCLVNDSKVLFNSDKLCQLLDSGYYDKQNWIERIELFDIEYLPVNHEVFSTNYSGITNIHTKNDDNKGFKAKSFNTISLGKQKTDTWDVEKESRILCKLNFQDFEKWSFIDLRLKESIFKDLRIIMNPWAEANLKNEIERLIDSSPISDEIKSTITIQHSCEEGNIN